MEVSLRLATEADFDACYGVYELRMKALTIDLIGRWSASQRARCICP